MESGRPLDAARGTARRSIALVCLLLSVATAAAQTGDERVPLELGSAAFRQKKYSEAARWLHRALRANPSNDYTADFLATIYFLQGNTEAALKYWNRTGKPYVDSVHVQPGLRMDAALLDRAFVFAPSDRLQLRDYLSTRARLDALNIFSPYTLSLDARDDGKFDVSFQARERNGWGGGKRLAFSMLRGALYQTVQPEYFNFSGSAVNFTSLVRWDAQKRRVTASVSAPLGSDPRNRYVIGVDTRNENWELRRETEFGAFKLRRSAVSGGISSYPSGDWSWSVGGELSHRDYRNITGQPEVTHDGYQLKQSLQFDRQLWRVPERRFEGAAQISAETGRIWSAPSRTFERLQASLTAKWLPRMTGDDYAIRQQFRAGRIFGQAPFDELFVLGLERDTDLWMRAHIGTHDGRKGSAPVVRRYFLSNWEVDKKLYGNGLVSVKLSPFVDVGRGAGRWFRDTGAQIKLDLLGVGFVVVYGKDLRTGGNAFYVLSRMAQ